MPQPLIFFANVVGIVPAVLLMYYLLKTYDRYLKDIYMAGTLGVGLLLGVMMFLFHLFIDPIVIYTIDGLIFIYIMGFALFENITKLMVLNHRIMRDEKGTAFYGTTLGLGMGITSIMAIAYMDALRDPEGFQNEPWVIPTFIVLAFGFSAIQGATGAIIGYGAMKGRPWLHLGYAMVAHMAFNTSMAVFIFTGYPGRFAAAILVASVGFGALYLAYMRFLIASLPRSLLVDRRRRLRKGSRVRRRKEGAGLGALKDGGGDGNDEEKGIGTASSDRK